MAPRRPRRGRVRATRLAAALCAGAILSAGGPAGAAPSAVLLGRSPAQLAREGWVLRSCDGAQCAGPSVDGGPFGRGSEIYGIDFYRGRDVTQYQVRLPRAETVALVRTLVLTETPKGTTLGAFSVSYAPGQDVDVATGVSSALASWTRSTNPQGKFCVYLSTAPTGRFLASDVRGVLVAAWVKGVSGGGC